MPGDGEVKLSEKERLWLIKLLAFFERPKAIQQAWAKAFPNRPPLKTSLIEDHDFDNAGRRADAYARTNRAHGARILRKHVEQFDAWREAWLAEIEREIPECRTLARIRLLADDARRCLDWIETLTTGPTPNFARADAVMGRRAALLKQIAEEDGGVYTNKRDVTSNGESIKVLLGVDLERI